MVKGNMKGIIKLSRNRVRRNYLGGKGIDLLHGSESHGAENYPEEWIGSLTQAVNLGMEEIPNEGLAYLYRDGEKVLLRDLIEENRSYYLGENADPSEPPQMGVLVKILDSAMRLHIQAHPDREYARKYLHSKYGKLECYYILSVQDPENARIWLGFQNSPGREKWEEILEKQDKAAMEACFENIHVNPGEVWVVPGGMPHAIGEGITMIEIMEPSDLVVRCEFEREGVIVPEGGRFMGKTLKECLDIFDYREYSAEAVRKKCSVVPRMLQEYENSKIEYLIDKTITEYFKVLRLTASNHFVWKKPGNAVIAIVVSGSGKISTEPFRRGDSFFLAAAEREIEFTELEEKTEIILVCSQETNKNEGANKNVK